jgi:hypothetical protein
VTSISRFKLGHAPQKISGNADRLVYSLREPGDRDEASVMSLDVRTGDLTRVAHSEFDHGFINWAGVSGSWTVFVDQSHVQGNGGMDVLWRVVAVNPELHQRRVLLSNGEVPDPWVPWLGSRDDYVYWSSAESDAERTAREWLWRHDWSRPRALLRHMRLTPGSESIGGDSLVYLGAAAARTPGRHVGGDCWRVPLAGGSPEALTHTGRASGCAADATWLVWNTLIDPSTRPAPKEGFIDNPYELWAERIDERKPMLVHRGYTAGGWPLVQDGFAISWDRTGHRVIHDLRDPRSRIRLPSRAWDLGTPVGERLALPDPVGQRYFEFVDIVDVSRAGPTATQPAAPEQEHQDPTGRPRPAPRR